ncbi:hypothetical protein [Kribbella soli]|uniref:Uncharacterized protein n=1 Tax=Kribbella soli TaxID=1124743 RepID=A0A4V2LXP5_9ACTN|nr:hypothetical protein [Kribbella soli]TCC01326.1 hypothetical protein E0H45_42155 [Kribbella soli]
MEYLDNPAGRLLRLLQLAQAVPGATPSYRGWADVFGLADAEPRLVLRHGVRMLDMAHDVRTKVGALTDDEPELRLRNLDGVESILLRFTQIAGIATMEQFCGGLTSAGTHSLELCSSLLHRRSPEPVIEDQVLSGLRDDAARLAEEFENAEDLDEELRAFVRRHLFDIQVALHETDMAGAEPVRDEVNKFVGTIVTRPSLWKRLSEPKVIAIVTLLTAIDAALGISVSLPQLTQHEESKVIVNVYNTVTGCEVPEPEPEIVPADNDADDVHDAELVNDEERPAAHG